MSRVKFMHFHNVRVSEKVGSLTIAYLPQGPGIVDVAFSRCSNKDQFSRKVGRSIAESRLGNPKARRTMHWIGEDQKLMLDGLQLELLTSGDQELRHVGSVLKELTQGRYAALDRAKAQLFKNKAARAALDEIAELHEDVRVLDELLGNVKQDGSP